jgi:hypothetical protein
VVADEEHEGVNPMLKAATRNNQNTARATDKADGNDAVKRHPSFTRIRNLVAAGAIMAAAPIGASLAVSAQPAAASNPTQCVKGGCDLFAFGPANGLFFTTPSGTIIGMRCWEDSSWYDGTNRWFKISTIYGTGTAWVSANQVKYQINVGHC